MLSAYLNQTAQHTPAQRTPEGSAVMSGRGEISYLPPAHIPCRSLDRREEILTPQQQVLKVVRMYYVRAAVQVDDLLDGLRVQNVAIWSGLGGEEVGRKVWV